MGGGDESQELDALITIVPPPEVCVETVNWHLRGAVVSHSMSGSFAFIIRVNGVSMGFNIWLMPFIRLHWDYDRFIMIIESGSVLKRAIDSRTNVELEPPRRIPLPGSFM